MFVWLTIRMFTTKIEGCYYSDHDTVVTTLNNPKECGENGDGEEDGLASQSQVQNQDSCEAVRLSGINCDGEGDGLASQF